MKDPLNWMELALSLAEKAQLANEVPVAAVLVHQNKLIALAHNLVETRKDPTAHAEMIVLQKAAVLLKEKWLEECDLYVTLEPCPMCAGAISLARIRRLYFGAYDPKGGGVEHGPRVFDHPTCHHRPEIIGGIQEKKSSNLLKLFFLDKR
jgi:tRNA(adenine34) deaminase